MGEPWTLGLEFWTWFWVQRRATNFYEQDLAMDVIYFRKRTLSTLISKYEDHFTFVFYCNIPIQLILSVITLKCSFLLTLVPRILLILFRSLWPFFHIHFYELIFFFAMSIFFCNVNTSLHPPLNERFLLFILLSLGDEIKIPELKYRVCADDASQLLLWPLI